MALGNFSLLKRFWNSIGIFAAILLTLLWADNWHKIVIVWIVYVAVSSFIGDDESYETVDEQERLEKLKRLHDKGLITAEELVAKRQEILKDL